MSCDLGTGGDAPNLGMRCSLATGSAPDEPSVTQSILEVLPVAVPHPMDLPPRLGGERISKGRSGPESDMTEVHRTLTGLRTV